MLTAMLIGRSVGVFRNCGPYPLASLRMVGSLGCREANSDLTETEYLSPHSVMETGLSLATT